MPGELLQGDGFKLAVEPMGEYLRAHVFDGTDSLQVSISMWQVLAAQCRVHRAQRLLVVQDLLGAVSPAEIELVIEAIVGLGFADIHIAFVEMGDDMQGNEHAEILALERNIKVMVFSQEAEAKQWLLYGNGDR